MKEVDGWLYGEELVEGCDDNQPEQDVTAVIHGSEPEPHSSHSLPQSTHHIDQFSFDSDSLPVSSDDETLESSDRMSLQSDLAKWVIDARISRECCSGLLTLLRQHGHHELPKDCRTLLGTPSSADIIDKCFTIKTCDK